MSDFSFLDKRVVGGDQGEGVLIEQVVRKIDSKKPDDPEVYIEFMGTAKTVLRNNYNPMAGFDELPEPIPVSERWKVTLAGDKVADNRILAERLTSILQCDPPLEDRENEWKRFLKGTKDSVYDKLVGSKIFFQAKKSTKDGVTGEKAADYFFNSLAVARYADAREDAADEIEAILKKKRKKKEAASADAY